MRIAPLCLSLLVVLGAASLRAQAPVAVGATAGAVKLTAQRSERALTGVLQLQAGSWLSLSATPSFVHVSDIVSGRSVSSHGVGDLPLSADAFYAFPTSGSPVVAAALTMVLPTGNAACGLGSGETSFGLDLAAGASPSPRFHLSADASRSISGLSAQSTLSAPHATSLRGEASHDLLPRWTTSVSLGVDVGQSDSTQALSRTLGAGITHGLAGSLTLTLDGSVGLSAASPKWALSVGIGRVFAGTSPVNLSSPSRRLKSTFVGGVSRGKGGGKIGCR
ncbi:MAG TPA: transporter [Gemmatimonadales bacterium]|nr:transporter [Gemmatimonadales bacterium]